MEGRNEGTKEERKEGKKEGRKKGIATRGEEVGIETVWQIDRLTDIPSRSFSALTPLDVLLVEVKSAVRNRDAVQELHGQMTAW